MFRTESILISTLDIKIPLCEFEDIHQPVFPPKVHENPRALGGTDSIFNSADFLPHNYVKLYPAVKVGQIFMKILEGRSAGKNIFKFTQIYFVKVKIFLEFKWETGGLDLNQMVQKI